MIDFRLSGLRVPVGVLSRLHRELMLFIPDETGATALFSLVDAPPPPTYTGGITVAVERSALQIAPELIKFSVIGWTGFNTPGPTAGGFDARQHDIDYFWTFGDTGATFQVTERLPTAMRNANVGYGVEVAHVYGPGTYAVSCLAVERSSGIAALWEGSYTVNDPNVEYTGSENLYVSPSGNFSTKPAGAGEFTSLVAALNSIRNSATGKRRIILRRGEAQTMASGYSMQATWPSIYICAESGAGAKPIVTLTATGSTAIFNVMRVMRRPTVNDKIDFVLDGLDLRGTWDPTTETGLNENISTDHGIFGAVEDNPNRALPDGCAEYILVTNCDVRGFSCPWWIDGNNVTRPLKGIHNTDVTDWRDYAYFGDIGRGLCVLGSNVRQNRDTLGGSPKVGTHNRHGPFRIAGVNSRFVMDGCDLASTVGWFPNIPGYNTHQPCIRLFFNEGEVSANDRANIRRSIFEGGFNTIGIGAQDGGARVDTVNAVIGECFFIASHQTNAALLLQWRGITVENTTFITPNVPVIAGIYQNVAAVHIRANGTPGSATERIVVRHCTYANYKTTANGGAIRPIMTMENQSFTAPEAVQQNNLVHFPALNTPFTPDAPVAVANTIAPWVKGYRRRFEVFTGNLIAAVPNGGTVLIPYSGGSFFAEAPGSSTAYETATVPAVGEPNHGINVAGQDVNATFAFGGSGITVTNTSGAQWNSGAFYRMVLERNIANLPPVQTQFATPAENLGPVVPSTGSPAIGGAGTVYPRFDILSGNRRTIIDPLNRTAATRGAVEVALES